MQTYQATTDKPITQEYSIARLSKDNIKDLAFLHSEIYAITIKEAYFLKKYNTAYTGVEYIGFLAYNKDSLPIAFYGVVPCFISYQSRNILAAQSADTMTHPGHRYKGMFVDLSKRTFDLCKEMGIQLVFGFPNQNSYHGAVHKLGWKETEQMTCFSIPVNTIPIEKILKKMRMAKLYSKYKQFVLNKRLLPLQGIRNSVIANGFGGVNRCEEFLDQKNYNETKVMQINDAKIWFGCKEDKMMIGDAENVNTKNFVTVIRKLKRVAGLLGKQELQFHCSRETNLYQLFSSSFKASPSFPVLFQDFTSVVPIDRIKFTFADIDIF
jgi:hypothetical protein